VEREQDRAQPLGDRGVDQCGGGEGRSVISKNCGVSGVERMYCTWTSVRSKILLYTIL
jgi:hypothetical protein